MLRRRALAFAVLACAGCAATREEERSGDALSLAQLGRQLNCSAGLRDYEDAAFGKLDSQVVFALDYCEPMALESVRLEGGFHYAFDEADGFSGGQDVRLESESFELSAGLNYGFLFARLRPYLGLGASVLFLNLRGIDDDTGTVFDDDDVTAGGYAKAGVLFKVSPNSHVGVEYRHFEGSEASLDGTDLSTNYDQFLVVFGTSFE